MSTTCDAIMSCIAANLGRGLDFNETTRQIDLRISTDAGNTASIGTDDGFFAPTSPGPGDMVWLKTVATLPAEAIAAASGSNLVGPATAPELIEYSIANRIDIYSVPVYGVADGTIHESVGGPTTSVTTYTDNPGGIDTRYISSLTMQQLHYDAGSRDNPTGHNSNAPTSLLTPDGGWGGFYAPVYNPRTIDEMLRQIRGRMVVELNVQRASIPTAQIEADIRATVEAVVEAGAQEWVIIQIPALLEDNSRAPIDDWVPIVTDAGITAGVNATAETSMTSPFTPAEIVASGATWVAVVSQSREDGVDDARIAALVASGLQVEVTTSARQWWTTHAFGLGARAVRSPDAVYARGSRGEPGDLDYRRTLIPGLETRTTSAGALTSITDENSAMWNGGFARADLPGRWFPPRYAWVDGVSRFANSQILGEVSPIPNTTNFELRLRVRRHSGGTVTASRWAGIFWGYDHDRDISNEPGSGSNVLRNGYACVVHEVTATGTRASIKRYNAGVETTLASTVGGPGWIADSWVSLIVTVTGASIAFQAVGPSSSSSINTSDSTYRGAYVFYGWNDAGTGSATQYHGYNNYDFNVAVPFIYVSN
jgi:hypothetical protein